ncbi:hypothetical protein [Streptomyces misionensis]|uniref:hypothetical protein n=1 Tax=Streptomyces misionensis TaxID=67331 RepID=UPI00339FD929
MTGQLETAEDVRAFLALCLDPGPGRPKRTPLELTALLREPHLQALEKHAPHLATMRLIAEHRQKDADAARRTWAAGLAAWINDDWTSRTSSKPEGPDDPVTLMTQADMAARAAKAHVAECGACTGDMRLPELCADGQLRVQTAVRNMTIPAGRRLCPMNRIGDRAEHGEHFFKAAVETGESARCVYCGSRVTEPPAYRTPDQRLWVLTDPHPTSGRPLYLNTVGSVRCDSDELQRLYHDDVTAVWPEGSKPATVQDCPGVGELGKGLTGRTVHWGCCAPSSDDSTERAAAEAAAPVWVHNARSVNRNLVKHARSIADPSRTACPSAWEASEPMSADEAARLAVCGGCRRALTGVQD